jgi:Tol biopolymer transport system component
MNTLNSRIVFAFILILSLTACSNNISDYKTENKKPGIFPDYTDVVIPPNIAPLNFSVLEKGSSYHVEISSEKGNKINIDQSSPKICIPLHKWHNLLLENKGNILKIDVYVKNEGWIKYESIRDSIVSETLDNHLVYRLINPVIVLWYKMGIYQRNLENFDEKAIYENKSEKDGCVNCHMFCKNNPDKMTIHFRQSYGGTVIYNGDSIKKINTKTDKTIAAAAYPSWHPNGELIAYSTNQINQDFVSDYSKTSNVWDKVSDIVIYDVRRNVIFSDPKISTASRENLPTWSPNGKWIYFISAPEIKEELKNQINCQYDLLRIAFDPDTYTFGKIDTILTSRQTGLSITFPVISPDGKYLVFAMTDIGYFTIYHRISDLYLMNLETFEYHKLDINSPSNESYHSWSSNGRWLCFTSKRMDNIHSRPYFSYFDSNGKTHKPFVMPQEDPDFYNTFMKNYNRPELVTGEVKLNALELRDVVYGDPQSVKFEDNPSSLK